MPDKVDLVKQPDAAVIEVRLLPWRPRRRRLSTERISDDAGEILIDVGSSFDVAGLAVGLMMLGFIFVLAPVFHRVRAINQPRRGDDDRRLPVRFSLS